MHFGNKNKISRKFCGLLDGDNRMFLPAICKIVSIAPS